jgi:glycosyltransferase involved in cell wall biosynthesis
MKYAKHNMTTLSVVIPAYNEEKGIADIVKRVLATKHELQKIGVKLSEVIVVDDGSKDKTASIARNIRGVKVISHPNNKGYGAAVKTGFDNADSQLIGFIDADGTYPPEYFPQLCASIAEGFQLVTGSRMIRADSKMPLLRRIGNVFFAALLTIIGRQKITDSASGMRVFRREILKRLYPLPDGMNLTPVMTMKAVFEKIRMTEIGISYSERLGRSKLNALSDGGAFFESVVYAALGYNPARILGIAGIAAEAVAVLIFIAVVILRLRGIASLDPWGIASVFIMLVASITGISIFCLGIIANYMVGLFNIKYVRPRLFGHQIFKSQIDIHFCWLGILMLLGGVGIGITSLVLGLHGWNIDRTWFYLLGSAMLILIGVQLINYWVILRVLSSLKNTMGGKND